MADIKTNSDSEEVGIKFKVIIASLTITLNGIIFTWYFFFSGLRESG